MHEADTTVPNGHTSPPVPEVAATATQSAVDRKAEAMQRVQDAKARAKEEAKKRAQLHLKY